MSARQFQGRGSERQRNRSENEMSHDADCLCNCRRPGCRFSFATEIARDNRGKFESREKTSEPGVGESIFGSGIVSMPVPSIGNVVKRTREPHAL
jgi:hypothetical protein